MYLYPSDRTVPRLTKRCAIKIVESARAFTFLILEQMEK